MAAAFDKVSKCMDKKQSDANGFTWDPSHSSTNGYDDRPPEKLVGKPMIGGLATFRQTVAEPLSGKLLYPVKVARRIKRKFARRSKSKTRIFLALSKLPASECTYFEPDEATGPDGGCFIVQGEHQSPIPGVQLVNVDNLKTVDELSPDGVKYCGVKDVDSGELVFYKVPRTEVLQLKQHNERIGWCFGGLLDNMNLQNRGKKAESVAGMVLEKIGVKKRLRSVFFGYRQAYNLKPVATYGFRTKAAEKLVRLLQQAGEEIAMLFESMTHRVVDIHETIRYAAAIEEHDIPTIGLTASQISLSDNYCSPVHTDKDAFFCTLGARVPTRKENDDRNLPDDAETVLLYFCFPRYGVKVPIRHGDLILFNSKTPHCATQSLFDDTQIFSCFLSNRTTGFATTKSKRRRTTGSTTTTRKELRRSARIRDKS